MQNDEEILARERGLDRSLTPRQLTMIGLGGAIGTGLFMGSGIAIGYAGPGVLVSYVIAAFIALGVLFSLSEMAVAHPTAGSFGTYAELYVNPWTGFLVRWTYWAAQVVAIGGEAIAVGHYMNYWWPELPVWLTALGAGVSILWVNSRAVANFGSVEYWLSTIKVAAIVAFIVFGLANVFGLGTAAVGVDNWFVSGGPFPHGFGGVWMAVIMAIFSFAGIELIAVTAGEAKDPGHSVPKAMRTMWLRLALFYFLALAVVLAVQPWTESGARVVTGSPFVKVFSNFGLEGAAAMMNFVIISAALSSMNTNLYLCSRMLFSLGRSGHAPAALGRVSARHAPLAAAVISSLGIAAAACTAYLSGRAYNYLFGIALFGLILTWIVVLVTHLRFRRRYPAELRARLPYVAPLFPWMQWASLALLAAILATMALDTEFWNVAFKAGVPWVVAVSVAYVLVRRARHSLRD